MATLTVTVTLAHPLSAAMATSLGIAPSNYKPGAVLNGVPVDSARRLISAGLTTIRPDDQAAIAALFGTAIINTLPTDTPIYISPTAPVNPPARYTWWQTGLGDDGMGMALWIEDGR